jgi:hypothetical protein
MPSRTALLDTNVLIAISGDDLATAKERGWHLATSPWTFFERLRHLDGKDFAEAKANFMKLRHVEIVDKPLDRLVAERQGSSEPRIWGSDLAREALDRISQARSKDDLKGLTMKDVAGNLRALENSVDTIHGILDTEKRRFQQLVTDIIKLIKTGDVPVATSEERHQAVLDMLASGESSFRDTEGLDYKSHASDSEILTFEYVYYAYAVLRAIAQKKAGGNTCAMNDFVDGQICAYVPLDQQVWVLTGDGPLLDALAATRSLLADVGMGNRACFEPATPDVLSLRLL